MLGQKHRLADSPSHFGGPGRWFERVPEVSPRSMPIRSSTVAVAVQWV